MLLKKSAEKDQIRAKILRDHAFGNKTRALVLLDIADMSIREFLMEAGKILDIAVLMTTGSAKEKSEYPGYDAFISE